MKKLLLFLWSGLAVYSVSAQKQKTSNSEFEVITCTDFHITKPLTELAKEHPYVPKKQDKFERYIESFDRKYRDPQKFVFSTKDDPIKFGNDPKSIQTEMGTRNPETKAPIKNWPGQSGSGFRPFDPSGAAGPNHYIQAINGTPFRVYNKSTGANMLTANIGSLWSPATPDDGDPIIMYDRYADRWFISQFGQTGNKIYIAISTTSDPLGSYYTYSFTSPEFPDYLKFGIWENGYYMTSNQATDRVFCFERDQMLVGNASARAVSATFSTGAVSSFFVPLPADADGGLPTAGTPCPFFSYSDNAWGGGAVDGVKIWNMTVSWGATPSATIALNSTIPTAAFDAQFNSSWDDVSQPGTSQKLDGIGGVPTYRAQWRKWSGYNSLVMNWGVYLSASQRSIKWVELRQNQTSGVWSLYQEGTYTPDAHTRWIGSIAMDNNGSIGLAYCKSSTSVYPSLCYTGRLATDPLGTMSFTETVAAAGTTAETSGNRYGDYSQLSLDPDGLTFWHTGEYTIAGGTSTRVYSFQLPLVAGAPVADFSADNTTPCIGSTVNFTDMTSGVPTSWAWTFSPNTVTYTGGTSATSQNPKVIFNAAGAYTVTLVATNTSGSNTMAKTAYINPISSLSLPLVENFEGTTFPPTNWTIQNADAPSIAWGTAGVKGLERRTATGNTGSTSGCAGIELYNYNDSSQVDNLISSPISLVGASAPKMTFKRAYKYYNSSTAPTKYHDELKIYISTDCGATWGSVVYFKKGSQLATNGTSNATFAPSVTADWDTDTINLTSYVGQSIKIKFEVGNRYGNNFYFDDINIANSVALVASAAIASNDADNTICAGNSVTFTATPTNGGTAPSYQWKVNGTNVGTNSATYTTTTLTNGQIVTCVMTSNLAGVTSSPATSNAITMTVNAIPSTPTVTTNSPVCLGSSITLSTTAVTSATYAWTGPNSYTNATQSPTLANSTNVMAGAYNLTVTVAGCTSAAGTSTVVINPTVTPSVTVAITAGGNPTCASQSVTFTATPTNGGTTPSYQWKVNGSNVGTNSATYTPVSVTNNDVVTCVMTSNATCPSPATATSSAITMTVTTSVTPSVAIALTSGSNPTCAGQSLTFTATPTNGGTTPSYQWKVNGSNVGTNSATYTSSALTNGQVVTCVMTSSSSCASPTTATSSGITITVSSTVTPSVSISATNTTICSGASVTFTATPTNGGTTPSYQWKVNGSNVGTNSATYTSTTLTNGQVVTCVMTSSNTCASPTTATSSSITMTVNSNVTPSVAIALTSGSNPSCIGSSVTFTATPTNGGSTPAYQWEVNGTNVGTNSATFTSSTLANNDLVTCVMTSNATCLMASTAISTGTTMQITSNTPSVVISASSNPACIGSSVTFTASPTNGGTTPAYQWKVNGTNAGTNSNTFTSSSLANNDIVTCVITSNATCLTTSTATSSGITMTFTTPVTPAISIAITSGANPLCAGDNIVFSASTTNEGTSPSFQWKVNGTNVGTNNSIFGTSTLANNDVVSCTLTSNLGCVTSSTATSTGLTMTVNAIPPTPTITQNGDVLTSSATQGNQWYLNGVQIVNAINQVDTASVNGNYTVISTVNGCPSVASSITTVSSVGLNEVAYAGNHFTIYPNPSNGKFTVVFTSTELMKYNIVLHDVLGRVIYEEEIKDFNGIYTKNFDVTEYGKGEYFITIVNSKKQKMEKVIVY